MLSVGEGCSAAAHLRLVVWCKTCDHRTEPNPAEIQHAVWGLSAPHAQLLRRRGSPRRARARHLRSWVVKFGPLTARRLRRRRPRPSDRWHLDEMVARIAGKRMRLWRAVYDEGEVLHPRRPRCLGIPGLRAVGAALRAVPTMQCARRRRSRTCRTSGDLFRSRHNGDLRAPRIRTTGVQGAIFDRRDSVAEHRRHDRLVKLPVYRQIETVQEIALVASDEIYAEVHRRCGVQWITEILRGGEAVLNSLQSRSRSGFPISTKASHSSMPKATRPAETWTAPLRVAPRMSRMLSEGENRDRDGEPRK